MERTNTSQSHLGTYVFVLTKRWNEDDPARWPQSVAREKEPTPRVQFRANREKQSLGQTGGDEWLRGKYNLAHEFNERRQVKNAVDVLF
ncbi:MAG TPA: hypothetical protein VLB46_11235 [Pyrinomonadaceae bacterium]|nr:hypothetical protein [Pyrinomonadaceae bacterium]